jgi:hypothetical protein
MNLVMLIPDGVGVRNFLTGSFLAQAQEHFHCHILHAIPPELLNRYQHQTTSRVQWEALLPFRESVHPALLRYALGYAHMTWADTQSMRHLRNQAPRGSWRNRLKHHLARGIGRWSASPAGIQRLAQRHCQSVSQLAETAHYRQLFQQLKPALVFASHQRPPEVIPPVLAARSLGIPTATFIFSWDNLSSKGRIAAPFDHFLVWSELMANELLRYYPDVRPEQVHIVGTPQFDPYAEAELHETRAEFFARFGADPARPLLCYSGGDKGTAPEDQEHVRILLELIRSGAIQGQPQVLLRPAPVDEGTRFAAVRRAFPELIYAPPAWVHARPDDWTQVIPLAEDSRFLANLTMHADLNINLASTMTLDFAIHDKPVVNVAFDVAEPPPHGLPLWDYYYQFEHYQPVIQLGAARIARSRAELAEHVNAYLANPALDREGRQKFVELEVGLLTSQTAAANHTLTAPASNLTATASLGAATAYGSAPWLRGWPRSAPEILRVLQRLALQQ